MRHTQCEPQIQTRHFTLQPLEENFLCDQIEAFDRFLIPNSKWRVHLNWQKGQYQILIQVKTPFTFFRTQLNHPDLLTGLQKAFHKLHNQVTRHRQKHKDRRLRAQRVANLVEFPQPLGRNTQAA